MVELACRSVEVACWGVEVVEAAACLRKTAEPTRTHSVSSGKGGQQAVLLDIPGGIMPRCPIILHHENDTAQRVRLGMSNTHTQGTLVVVGESSYPIIGGGGIIMPPPIIIGGRGMPIGIAMADMPIGIPPAIMPAM